jgi:hypothetical protein
MSRRGIFICLLISMMIIVLLGSGVMAANETNNETESDGFEFSGNSDNSEISGEGIDRAYSCLESEIKDRDLSLQEAIFATLALGDQDDLIDEIEDERRGDCWPENSCTVKETAQVLLAYERAGENTEDIKEWLLDHSQNSEELVWYLEVDISNHIESECTVKYDGDSYDFQIREDMTLNKGAGSCLDKSNSGFWFEIDNNCLEEEFEVSCNEDFITALVYEKKNGDTVYVTGETHSASSLGTTTEKVDSKCFGVSGCDYEGTLWGVVALIDLGMSDGVENYLPYLIALSEDNKEYFPDAFLSLIVGGDDYYTMVVQSQDQGKFWDIAGSPYNRFYDTSLGMLALRSSGGNELDGAKQYLLDIQTQDGCWNNNNVRDTGFVLYSGWGRNIGGGSSGGGQGIVLCESAGNYCGNRFACLDAGGLILGEYECTNFAEVCCSINPIEFTCGEKGGVVCGNNEQCSGSVTSSLDGSCCLGSCEIISDENQCERFGGICRTSCLSGEESNTDTCTLSGDICCVEPRESSSGIGIWVWIILLFILIILVVLAIIFRDKLKLWWYKIKNRKSKPKTDTTQVQQRPAAKPMMRRFVPSPSRGGRVRKAGRDKELEETMRKLRDMSK